MPGNKQQGPSWRRGTAWGDGLLRLEQILLAEKQTPAHVIKNNIYLIPPHKAGCGTRPFFFWGGAFRVSRLGQKFPVEPRVAVYLPRWDSACRHSLVWVPFCPEAERSTSREYSQTQRFDKLAYQEMPYSYCLVIYIADVLAMLIRQSFTCHYTCIIPLKSSLIVTIFITNQDGERILN